MLSIRGISGIRIGYPPFLGTPLPRLPSLKFYVAYTAAFVLYFPWRLSPFVSLGYGNFILTLSIAFCYPYGLTSIVYLHN